MYIWNAKRIIIFKSIHFDLLVKNTSLGYYLILVSVSKARDHE